MSLFVKPGARILKSRYTLRSRRQHQGFRSFFLTQRPRDAKERSFSASLGLCVRPQKLVFSDYSATSEEIMRVFENLADTGQTVIMVTHEPDIAAHARRVVVLRDGVIASDDRRSAFKQSMGIQ